MSKSRETFKLFETLMSKEFNEAVVQAFDRSGHTNVIYQRAIVRWKHVNNGCITRAAIVIGVFF